MHLQSAGSAVVGPTYGAPVIGGRELTEKTVGPQGLRAQIERGAYGPTIVKSPGYRAPAQPFVDASLALPQAGTMSVPLTDEAAGEGATSRRRWWPWLVGGIVVAGLIGGGVYYYKRRMKRGKRSKA